MKKTKDLVKQKNDELTVLKEASESAIDVVTSTINQLSNVNDNIVSKIAEIEKIETELAEAKTGFEATREHNSKVIGKFRSLIEV